MKGSMMMLSLALLCAAADAQNCSTYSKNSVGPVTSEETCRTACETAEGLSFGPKFKTNDVGVECACYTGNAKVNTRGVCVDSITGSASLQVPFWTLILSCILGVLFRQK
mmetsp:Transcript_24823/g.38977  ORF Transcript_24823/g.38977 Transcript_24823/m.38977 type:complete len:110 (-) Transcript_24823:226-555(-)|eukprot:CAMPEP_0184295466 /NCGR_PEP_ID=MMETSP1049-20130417/6293_1 /TAXON_ID=77928 /ORGANISM="Proteomonas sulcata, Strain CCMP704" /LENGTH=109 /DNA_ID=CAMNT_0026603977 /DNA_START=89 /DNA_END=418 /DNA_ORIENTATION=-